MEGVDEGKACSGNALMIPRDLCHSLLKHLFAKAEDIPQSFVTEPEGYKMILDVAQAIRDRAESEEQQTAPRRRGRAYQRGTALVINHKGEKP